MDISIIIVNYNTKDLTNNCIKSIREKTKYLEYEIILVDNNSSDNSVDFVREKYGDSIKIIKNKENIGFGKANNEGIKLAKGKYIFLLNSDTVLINNVLKIFFDYMENNNEVAICGGDLFNEDMTKQISYGFFPTVKQVLFEEFQLSKLFKDYYRRNLSVGLENDDNEIKYVEYISGADMFIKREIIDKMHFFDKDFFLYYEETELNYRVNKLGYKTVLIPEAKIIHLCGKSSQNTMRIDKFKIQQKSKFLFFKKCYGVEKLKLLRIILLIAYYLKYIATKNHKYKEWIIETNKIYKECYNGR